jgi:SAM-dependent methyltransferase
MRTAAEHAPRVRATRCAICGTEGEASVLYPATFDVGSVGPGMFSARRPPDRVHYRMVRCLRCGLVRSDPVLEPAALDELYARSGFHYAGEIPNLRATYGHFLYELDKYGVRRQRLLDIGCGNGFLLEEALDQGFTSVHGVEPSQDAVAKAGPRVATQIVCDVMRPGLFEPGSFDVVCLFQVLDHIADPRALLEECRGLLAPGGLILAVNHNVASFTARMLGERSPIVDIEHTYLYSPATMSRLFEAAGLVIRHVGAVRNTFSLEYLIRLAPFPPPWRALALRLLAGTRLRRVRLTLPLGNLRLVGQRPPSA